MSNPYLSYLGKKPCCNLDAPGPIGPTGLDGPTGLRGNVGLTGLLGHTGPTGRDCTGPTGSTGPANKTFIIDHPTDISKYLMHACLEGPEAGVYYRGKATIENNESATIILPEYLKPLASNLSVQITPIYSQERSNPNIYESSEIENNSFQVYGKNGSFYWTVYGTKDEIQVEPNKSDVNVKKYGPYAWY